MSDALEPLANVEAERGVLGALFCDSKSYWKIAGTLQPEAFYFPKHQRVFKAIVELIRQDSPVDLITTSDLLTSWGMLEGIGGVAYLTDLCQTVSTATSIKHHAKLVQEVAWIRSIEATGHALVGMAREHRGDPGKAVELATRRLLGCFRQRSEIIPFSEAVSETIQVIEKTSELKGALIGLPTGFADLDRMTGGFQPEQNIVIGGRTGMGKTAMVCHMLLTQAFAGRPVALITLEMSRTQIAMRALAAYSQVAHYRLKRGFLDAPAWQAVARAANRLAPLPFYLVEMANGNMGEVLELARRLQLQHGIQALAIDNMNLLQGGREYKYMSENSRLVKAGATELKMPVLALYQLKREIDERPDKHPTLTDLKQSGEIENDADVVLFLYREGYYRDLGLDEYEPAELDVAKQRDGATGVIHVTWRKTTMSFEDRRLNG